MKQYKVTTMEAGESAGAMTRQLNEVAREGWEIFKVVGEAGYIKVFWVKPA